MRYLKRQSLNRRIANDPSLYVDPTSGTINSAPTISGNVVMGVTNSLVVPIGGTANQPGSPVNGMIRYNSDTNQFEGYQSNNWRSFRFKEPGLITQQNLGAGDGTNLYFGPLIPAPATNAQSGVTWAVAQMAKNILVVVENVLQLSGTNYEVVQNPASIGETSVPYVGATSATTNNGATTMYFNSSLIATGASGNGSTVRLTFSSTYTDQNGTTQTRALAPFAVGSTIVVTGFNPSGYNGNQVVTACTTTYVEYSSTISTTMITAGAIASTVAIYPATTLVGATFTNISGLFNPTTVLTYFVDSNSDALVSVTLLATTGSIAANTPITLTEVTTSGNGYYLKFSSPPPYGKIVTALIGFDQ